MNFSANIYRLLMLLLVLLATSCNHNEDISVTPDSDTDKVHFTIGVSLPGASPTDSRAFGGEGTDGTGTNGYFEFSDLYVAVFVEKGGLSYLEEFVKAESTVPTWNSEGYWEFGVELTKTDGPRRLHLIANYPDLMLGFGEEGELIGRLLANGANHDVYWNYRNLNRIDEGYESELRDVPLLRNYVQIRLDKTELTSTNFILDGYALFNVPTKGTVAPYNPSSENKFANFVDNNNQCQSYSYMLNTEKYVGNEPFDDGSFLDKNVSQLDWKEPNEPIYIYERNHSNTNEPTCMLIKGRYVENGEPTPDTPPTYYKLDFVYDETNTNSKVYYNLLRNFIYTMNLNSVTGPGYDSIEEALKQPASNNIGGDAVAKDYTNISDGIGRLFVSSTYILFTKQKTVDLYYKYIPDIVEAPNTTDNGSVTITPQTGEVLNNPSNLTGTAVTGGQYDKWNKVQLVSNEVQTESKSQHIIFAAGNLQREVELILRSPYTLDVDVLQDKVATQPKQPVTIEIELPGGIEQLLPLRLFISSQDNTIYPDYGTNIPAESQNGKYGFIKEVSLLEYQNSNTITCNFRTNCADNATTVYVDNEYFNRGTDSFENLNMSILFSDEAKHYGIGQEFEMTFETDRAGAYSLSGNLVFVSVSGNGASLNVENKKLTVTAGGTYTITCRTTTWADAANVTITSDTDNSYSVIGIGDKRNVLFIKPNSITGPNIQNNTEIRLGLGSKIASSNWDNATEIGNRNNLINNGYSYVVENLKPEYEFFYLGYRRSYWGSYTYYNSEPLKASDLAGTGLDIECSSN